MVGCIFVLKGWPGPVGLTYTLPDRLPPVQCPGLFLTVIGAWLLLPHRYYCSPVVGLQGMCCGCGTFLV